MTEESPGQAAFGPSNPERDPSESMHVGTGGSRQDPDASYNEHTLERDAAYDADADVVRPYEIEEPDDDLPNQFPRPRSPKLLEEADQWQTELVRSLRQLHCESDTKESCTSPSGKRGQKRKPSTNSTVLASSLQPQSADTRNDLVADSPKRRRRRSRRSNEDMRSSILQHFSSTSRGTSPRTSTSSTPQSTPATSEVHRGSDADEMEIDSDEAGS